MIMKNARLAWSGWLAAALLVMTGWAIRNDNTTAADEAAIDAVYERVSQAYAALDKEMILDAYTDDAYYLIDTAQRLLHGKEDLARAFTKLDRMKQKGGRFAIEFRIVNRNIQGDMAYDVGYYKLTQTRPTGQSQDLAAKFVTVLKRQADGSWRFQVDSYSQAMLPAFDKAE